MMYLFLDCVVMLYDLNKQCKEILKNSDNTLSRMSQILLLKKTTKIVPQEDETSSDDPIHEDSTTQLIMEERDILVKGILNCEDGDSVNDIDEDIEINAEELGGDISNSGSKNYLYKIFLSVVTAYNIKVLGLISMGDNIIVKAMTAMKMKNRESGTCAGIFKHNTLNGRWTYPPSLVPNKTEHVSEKDIVSFIEQGSVISFEYGSEWFLVCTVFRSTSTTLSAAKWYP